MKGNGDHFCIPHRKKHNIYQNYPMQLKFFFYQPVLVSYYHSKLQFYIYVFLNMYRNIWI